MKAIDRLVEFFCRHLALRLPRRSFFASFALFIGAAKNIMAVPVERPSLLKDDAEEKKGKEPPASNDPATSCSYWRYCSLDGFLCSCCGGGATACPPGTFPSPTHWVGSCRNPEDGKHYLVSYRDCCGKGYCGRCYCRQTDAKEMPVYQLLRNNDTIWCFGAPNMIYHCTGAAVLAPAQDNPREEREPVSQHKEKD
ncbi:methylamine dehydrogenase light chain [Candidatus Methylacidiphilum infernorum]|uniref:Methylamine dehydrogenase small subunit n=2 Tax=Methylacidiphilum infernorum (isolate V4) TaxID=481448 RepID=A9QPC3_METI4|nr:methylamine dehydrogenase light chain [Candidatus Methylacidiphilum infernorum]ABX56581.1 methylamine dehydrogenase small subunit [Methylacidiphilum infernorum V4]